ncbi:MAG: formylmethanofuran--tetrahydromethanopterin N-formyltransferase [Pseudomonadota bacterium]|nr:formylmethanofuran--tetrahydromethanopterin N-formyltransferase [Pseudomonadota bacterium]
MPGLSRNGVRVDETFAEAFEMRCTALVITADSREWARQAAVSMTGFATSVIACGVEAGIDREVPAAETPDGRPGIRVLLFASATTELQRQIVARVGQCVLTSPGSACFAGLAGGDALKLGDGLRYFGDGFQVSKQIEGRRFWRLPVMDGEFVCEGTTGLTKQAVGGGNLIMLGANRSATLRAAEAASAAIAGTPDAIAPFPGGITRSGSKVGSKYKAVPASTNHPYCPTLRGYTDSALDADTASVLEIVIDGITPAAVAAAMRAGMAAIIELGPDRGARRITAGNYGGKLGRHHFQLAELLQ